MKKKILFYYPQHFNRSKEGTNSFFDLLIETCDKYGIPYDVWEEPDKGTNKPRNPKAKKADTFFWTITVIRKIFSILIKKKDFYQREKYVAKVLNLISFNRYKYGRYITISGSMFHLFAALNPKGKVFDLQHGVVYKHHPTFFEENTLKLRKQFCNPKLNFLFWGKGYEDCFIKGEEEILNGRTHVVGYPRILDIKTLDLKQGDPRRDLVVVSLQFTHSISYDERLQMKELLWKFLEETKNLKVEILLKNHPRFNNSIEIDDIFKHFNHVKLTNEPLEELADTAFLHVTFYSTTAFEFAEFGIPTYFLFNNNQPIGEILYKEEYQYPLYWDLSIQEVVERLKSLENREKDGESVLRWFQEFYSPYDEKAFLKAIE